MIIHEILICSSFLISASKALLISSYTVIVRRVGASWLNPFATVLFSVCSAVHCRGVVSCNPCCMGVFWYVCCYVKNKGSCLSTHSHDPC